MTVEFAPPAVDRSSRAEWARLADLPAAADRFAVDRIDDLPEPARRWLTHAIAPETPLYRAVQLTMRGKIRIGTWRSFTARQVLAPPSGFIWAATARIAGLPVTGFDRYSSGTGQMRWRLAGLVPVMTGAGPDVSRSAAGRLAGEATCWLPTSFRSARWAPGPAADTAVATWAVDGEDEAVRIRVGADGRLSEALMQRWGNPDGQPFGRYPFGVAVEEERTFGGVRIPSVVRAGWGWGTDRQDAGEFFHAEITDATFR
jgi:uncharacterized protein DUF6544